MRDSFWSNTPQVFPGQDSQDQIRRIVALLGLPTEAEILQVKHERAREFLRTLEGPPASAMLKPVAFFLF